jgi:hypothetical protein
MGQAQAQFFRWPAYGGTDQAHSFIENVSCPANGIARLNATSNAPLGTRQHRHNDIATSSLVASPSPSTPSIPSLNPYIPPLYYAGAPFAPNFHPLGTPNASQTGTQLPHGLADQPWANPGFYTYPPQFEGVDGRLAPPNVWFPSTPCFPQPSPFFQQTLAPDPGFPFDSGPPSRLPTQKRNPKAKPKTNSRHIKPDPDEPIESIEMGVIRKKTATRVGEGGVKYHCDVCSVDVTSTVRKR